MFVVHFRLFVGDGFV